MNPSAERAVERTREVLRYHLSNGQLEAATMGWAVVAAANIMRPDVLPGPLTWEYLLKYQDQPAMLDLSWMASFGFDAEHNTDQPVVSAIVLTRDMANKMISIWKDVKLDDGDFLGDVYMALIA